MCSFPKIAVVQREMSIIGEFGPYWTFERVNIYGATHQ